MANAHNQKKNTYARECMTIALKRLLMSKKLDDISVSELVATAGTSRSTFYRNYHSISDIFTDYFMQYPFGAVSADEYSREGFDLRRRLLASFTFLKKEQNFINGMLEANMALLIYDNFNTLMRGLYGPRLAEMGFRSHYEVSAAAGLYFGICYDWIRGGMKESVGEMADTSYKILCAFRSEERRRQDVSGAH